MDAQEGSLYRRLHVVGVAHEILEDAVTSMTAEMEHYNFLCEELDPGHHMQELSLDVPSPRFLWNRELDSWMQRSSLVADAVNGERSVLEAYEDLAKAGARRRKDRAYRDRAELLGEIIGSDAVPGLVDRSAFESALARLGRGALPLGGACASAGYLAMIAGPMLGIYAGVAAGAGTWAAGAAFVGLGAHICTAYFREGTRGHQDGRDRARYVDEVIAWVRGPQDNLLHFDRRSPTYRTCSR